MTIGTNLNDDHDEEGYNLHLRDIIKNLKAKFESCNRARREAEAENKKLKEDYKLLEKENAEEVASYENIVSLTEAEVERLKIIMRMWKEGGIIPPEAIETLTKEGN